MNNEDVARQAESDWSGPGWYEVVYTVDGAVYCDNADDLEELLTLAYNPASGPYKPYANLVATYPTDI